MSVLGVNSQDTTTTVLTSLFAKMASVMPEVDKIKLAQEAEAKLISYLNSQNREELVDVKIPHLGRVEADNGLMAIYTWNIPLEDGGSHYYCVLHYKSTKKKPATVLSLSDATDDISVTRKMGITQWYGALYYTVLNYKVRKKMYYVVMGWDGHNSLISRKVIDVIVVSRNGNISLGAPVFQVANRFQNRVLFQYSAEVRMMLQYDLDKKMIVFDQLIPIENRYTGFYQYYSPSFAYDGYKLKKGKWWLRKDLDLRNAE